MMQVPFDTAKTNLVTYPLGFLGLVAYFRDVVGPWGTFWGLAIFMAALLLLFLFGQKRSQTKPGATSSVSPAAKVEYLSGIEVGASNRPADPVILVGTTTKDTPPLNVVVDCTTCGGSQQNRAWSLIYTAPIGIIPATLRNQSVSIPLVNRADRLGMGPRLWWGNPDNNYRLVAPHETADLDLVTHTRVRLAIGPVGQEQFYYFLVLVANPTPDSQRDIDIWPAQNEKWAQDWDNQAMVR